MMLPSPDTICQEIKRMSLPEVDLLPDPSGIVHRMLGNDGGWLFSLAASFISGKEKSDV